MFESIINLIQSIINIILVSTVGSEKEVNKNIEYLKQENWFQNLLKNEKYSELIKRNSAVRIKIASININKMENSKYNNKQKKKVIRALEKNYPI